MRNSSTDQEWWHLAQGGDAAAYARLRHEHAPLVRGELRRRLKGAPDEELADLEQDVWIAVWTALPTFRGHSAFATWVVGILKNRIGSWLRRKHTETAALAYLNDHPPEPRSEGDNGNLLNRMALAEAVKALAQRERQVILLRYFDCLSDDDIAHRLAVPLGTVKTRMRTGLRHLRSSL